MHENLLSVKWDNTGLVRLLEEFSKLILQFLACCLSKSKHSDSIQAEIAYFNEPNLTSR